MNAAKTAGLWAPVLLYTAFIFWLSSAPRAAPPLFRWYGADKLIHLGEYAPLGTLLLRAISGSRISFRSRFHGAAALAVGVAIGALDELFQGFVPTRQVSGWDLLADAAGVLLGLALYRWKANRS